MIKKLDIILLYFNKFIGKKGKEKKVYEGSGEDDLYEFMGLNFWEENLLFNDEGLEDEFGLLEDD